MSEQKVRISRPIISHLEGSSAWQQPNATLPDGGAYNDPESVSLVNKIRGTRTRKDGSVTVELTAAERDALAEHVDVQLIGARDNVSGYRIGDEGYGEYLGELNACNALLRQLNKLRWL